MASPHWFVIRLTKGFTRLSGAGICGGIVGMSNETKPSLVHRPEPSEPEQSETKLCPRCNNLVPLSGFGVCSRLPSGLQCWCRACRKSDAAASRPKIRVKQLASQRAKRARNPELYRSYFGKYDSNKFPERKKCRKLTHSAIRNGTLKKLPCEVCGVKKSEAHHADYSKPLEVKWLCRQHHAELHRKAL